jgi:hypothetical protein
LTGVTILGLPFRRTHSLEPMRLLLVTNDPVLLNYAEILLASEGIQTFVFDQNISIVEGSIGIFPRRLLVAEKNWRSAAHILEDAGLGAWLKDEEED